MIKLIQGDCRAELAALAEGSVDAVVCDPPYNIGKAKWDKINNYLEWSEAWIAECSRILKPNGAFWISHSKPLILAKLSEMVARYGRGLVNWVTWDKYNGLTPGQQYIFNRTKIGNPNGKRTYDQDAEYLIYHADEGAWTAQCDKERGFIFEPLRAYLVSERDRAGFDTGGVDREWQKARGTKGCMAGHWFGRVQWALPTKENYEWLRRLFNANGGEYLRREYEDLRREYEDLRREYEDLRYTFNNPGKMSSVWQIPPAKPNGHPTPKPEELIRRIIEATTNPGDMVLDPFCGSGTTPFVCQQTGRECIAIDNDLSSIKIAQARISHAQDQQAEMLPLS